MTYFTIYLLYAFLQTDHYFLTITSSSVIYKDKVTEGTALGYVVFDFPEERNVAWRRVVGFLWGETLKEVCGGEIDYQFWI